MKNEELKTKYKRLLAIGYRRLILSVLLLILLLARAPVARAEAVYLKNGGVVVGRVVEKTQTYLVVKTGEGEGAVKVTIFFEDINRIESDEDFQKKSPDARLDRFLRGGFKIRPGSSFFSFGKVTGKTSSEFIRALLESDRQARLLETFEKEPRPEKPEPGEIDLSHLPQGVSREEVEDWLKRPDRQEALQLHYRQQMQEIAQGSGTISGTVYLPVLGRMMAGPLYVYLMKEVGRQRYFTGADMIYTKIKGIGNRTEKADYTITGIPPGTYRVFAEWDVSGPAVREETIDGHQRLRYLGGKGDYRGTSRQSVSVEDNTTQENVYVDCRQLIQVGPSYALLDKRPDFVVTDIYYHQLAKEAPRFFMVVSNRGATDIDLLAFRVLINDVEPYPYPLEFTQIRGGVEKEFDITSVYVRYQGVLKTKGLDEPQGPLTFKVVWPLTDEVEFEKTVLLMNR